MIMHASKAVAVLLLLTVAISTRSEIVSFGEGDSQFTPEFVTIRGQDRDRGQDRRGQDRDSQSSFIATAFPDTQT